MAWQPNPQGLQEIVNLLLASRQATNVQHREIQAKIVEYNHNPEFNCYLVHIFACIPAAQMEDGEAVRQRAGLLLKNNVRQSWKMFSPVVLQTIQGSVLKAIADPSAFTRRIACTVVATIAQYMPLDAWPALMPTLIGLLDNADPLAVDGAFRALEMICEDVPEKMDCEYDGVGRPVNAIVTKSLAFFTHASPSLRRYAVACIGNVLKLMPAVLCANMEQYLGGISALASDPDTGVRKNVAIAIVLLMEMRPDVLQPHLVQVCEFMLRATQDVDGDVALQACEFWHMYACSDEELLPPLRQALPRVVPVLLARMAFSEEAVEELEAQQEEDSAVPDRPEEVRPIFHRNREGVGGGAEGEGGGEGGEGDDDGVTDDDGEVSQWTLRKCAANGLDSLAHAFGGDVLPVLLPLLQQQLQLAAPQQWPQRESAILALGAISDGCYDDVAQDCMPQLYPFLLSLLGDATPSIRSIACWALGRYAHWAAAEPARLQPLVEALLRCVRDRNKKVQEAACSAFATLTEVAGPELCPFLVPILQVLVAAFREYQTRNLLMLYDAIGTLAESMAGTDGFRAPACAALVMPPLIEKWQTLPDNDRQLFPLFECLASVAKALGEGFAEYAVPVWARGLRIAQAVVVAHATSAQTGEEPPDKEFATCAIDLLGGIVDALKARAAAPELAGCAPFLPLLLQTAQDPDDDMRQSTWAMVGDLCLHCPDVIVPALGQFAPIGIEQLRPEYLATAYNVSPANNAAWALGTMAQASPERVAAFAPAITQPLLTLLRDPDLELPSMTENMAIAVGRFAGACPTVVAPVFEANPAATGIPSAIAAYCGALKMVTSDAEEKECAYRGLCAVVQQNPGLCAELSNFFALCIAIADYGDGDGGNPQTHQLFGQLLGAYKAHFGAQWPQVQAELQKYKPALLQHLASTYQL
eukprot:g3272.t1